MIDITKRKNIKEGMYVKIKTHNNNEVNGYVKRIISKNNDKNGIRVIIKSSLTNSIEEGVIIDVPSKNDVKKEVFKFYNLFFSEKEFYSFIDCNNNFLLLNISNEKKAICIFSNALKAKEFLEKYGLNNKYSLKRIGKKNYLCGNFKDLKFNYYLLNNVKLVARAKFDEVEKYFVIHS